MTTFVYRGYTANGTETSGTVEAADKQEAMRLVLKSGCRPLSLEVAAARSQFFHRDWSLRPAFRSIDFGRFFSELQILLEAGFTIDAALKTVVDDREMAAGREELSNLVAAVMAGGSFSSAFAHMQNAPPEVTALLLSGEQAGRLEQVVASLAQSFEDQKARRAEAIETLLYPAFLLAVMLFSIGVIMFVLVPAIEPVFEGAEHARPMLISVLSAVRRVLVDWARLILPICVFALAAAIGAYRTSPGRRALSNLLLHMPIAGRMARAEASARYLQVLATLTGNGVGVKKALELAAQACPLAAYAEPLLAVRDRVVSGTSLRQAIEASGLFEQSTLSLIKVGDESNKLPEALKRAAYLLERKAREARRRLFAMLTPTLTITMGALVGGVVISVMTALLSINNLAAQ
ncbi:general secretion pathway protein F, GspF [Sinorhizobium fredii NGR234]|uniref:General secretion pathway protein F, GspF n=1 Tax=Sinorhizobium fredii (strain NBRC 101917 / NGR234) TaxID=394 RepID=C3MFK4_SINFN|nr:type II secretion system F family protein [Sinorhizobium fredii]ACP26061.1 general secretion pathway protein F, GspF [Sinorhizobium fredii NGR234]